MTKDACHASPMPETMIIREILAYTNATKMFNHLLICGLRKIDRNIIRAGMIKITEKITRSLGEVGPTGV